MKSEIRFKKTAVFLLAAALICTVLAAFLPYSLEPLLGIAAACIAIHIIYLAYEKYINLFWIFLAAIMVSVISVILTLVLILGHRLELYTPIHALNLIVIGLSAFILLHKKWVYRAVVWIIAIICPVFAAFGAFSHIVYGRSVMATVDLVKRGHSDRFSCMSVFSQREFDLLTDLGVYFHAGSSIR